MLKNVGSRKIFCYDAEYERFPIEKAFQLLKSVKLKSLSYSKLNIHAYVCVYMDKNVTER
jgi:hypothetical protein